MNHKINAIGIIKETRNDESRAPLAPLHIKQLKKKYLRKLVDEQNDAPMNIN